MHNDFETSHMDVVVDTRLSASLLNFRSAHWNALRQ